MKISFINPLYNHYSGNTKKKTVVHTIQPNNISFQGLSEDQKIASKYFRDFSKMMALEDAHSCEGAFEKDLDKFFSDLNKETLEVQKRFLMIRNGEQESAYVQSLCSNCIEASREIIKLYNKADEKTRFAFIIPPKSNMGSPFFTAVDLDQTLEIAKELRKMVKTLTPEHQGQFYYYHLNSLFGEKNTVIDELKDSGSNIFVRGLEADKKKFNKTYPELALKYQKKYPQPENKIPFKTFKEEADVKKETAQKSTKFRVYENVKTRFSDVGGMFNVKQQIKNELLNILNNPKVKNADKPAGIILYGPPGTGKTLLATAIAGEAGIPFISTAGSGFNEIYVGAGAKHIRELYATARDVARAHHSKTAIVFIDEADAVAGKRGNSESKENDHTLNALLTELDGVQSKEESDIKVITILATNRKDMFDEAFRKGRIDLEFKIDDPRFSEKARKEILEINAKGKPFKDDETKDKLLSELAQTSSGMSGAELADVIKRAYRKTLYNGRKTPYITHNDITEAKLEALIGIKNDTEKSEFEQKSVLAHEAGHAINQLIMNRIFANEIEKSKLPIQKLDFIVNESRGDAAGITMMKPSPDNRRLTVESLMSSLVVSYGGYSIEEEMFDGHTDGVSSDLENCTNLILNSVTKWGLGSKTKFIGCAPNGLTFELFKGDIKQDIIDYSNKAMSISSDISKFVKPFVEEYIDTFFTPQADKSSIITGAKFEKMFDEWLRRNGNKQSYLNLCAEIREGIANFKTKIKS